VRVQTLLFLVALLAAAGARADETIEQPQVHVGDAWRYNRVSGSASERMDTHTEKVIAISDIAITVQIERLTSLGREDSLQHYDLSWNLVDNSNVIADPSQLLFKYPFRIGDQWNLDYRWSRRATGERFNCLVETKVVGQEKVAVPAGTFEAARIEIDSHCHSTGADALVYQFHDSVWYAPTVNRYIKFLYTRVSDGRVREKWSDELTEYQPAK
jgi:hypothetical protein